VGPVTLAKLTILPETGLPVLALFNPQEVTISKSVNWKRLPVAESDVMRAQFTHGEPAVLSLDLLFDTYELGLDVRLLTGQVEELATVRGHGSIHRPPVCKLVWGAQGVFFEGVLTSVVSTFTMFSALGSPVRARLQCSFTQWLSARREALLQHKQSPDVAKSRVVRRGDTLSGIAALEYDDPALWRPIALANGIVDPLHVEPGRVLTIPVLTAGGAA
jgi:nucleoid-associated protein YgaU